MNDRKFQERIIARVWFDIHGASLVTSMPAAAMGEPLPWALNLLDTQDGDGAVEFIYLENYVTSDAQDDLIDAALGKGSTAFRRRCNVCGRVFDVLLVRDGEADVSVICAEGAYRGRAALDYKTSYEMWCCRSDACRAA